MIAAQFERSAKIMDQIATHLFAFLVGIAGGAAGTYYAELFSDQRRKKESLREIREAFDKVKFKMPVLFDEMRADLLLAENHFKRDFFVINRNAPLMYNGKVLVYYKDDHENLLDKVKMLKDCGYVEDITPKNAPMFRMSEHFVEFLTK